MSLEIKVVYDVSCECCNYGEVITYKVIPGDDFPKRFHEMHKWEEMQASPHEVVACDSDGWIYKDGMMLCLKCAEGILPMYREAFEKFKSERSKEVKR